MPRRPERRRIFVGCEGKDEQSYVRFISDLPEMQHAYLHTHFLRGSDPLVLVHRAYDRARNNERQHGKYVLKALLVDSDRVAGRAGDKQCAERAAQEAGIRLVWQRPCYEGLLLRHLENCQRHDPPDARSAMRALQEQWPGYVKGMTTAAQLRQRLDAASVRRAAETQEELRWFLEQVGFGLGL